MARPTTSTAGADAASVRRFVRDTLGCTCPDDVFQAVELGAHVESGLWSRKLTIGDRLLVYVVEVDASADLDVLVPAVIEAGKVERDTRRLNRFRAVIATEDVKGVNMAAQRVFAALPGRDKRVHLHVVPRKEVPV